MDNKLTRAFINKNKCVLGAETGPQTVVVRQIIGERETQKVLDIHIKVPERKPAVEQIIDVFVKNLKVLHIDVITDRIVVRGELEIKAIYVAAVPEQAVHAVELKHYKFSQEVEIPCARRGMDAEAVITVDFVDYDVAEYTRAYKYKNYEHINCFDICDSTECEEDFEDECKEVCPVSCPEKVECHVDKNCAVLAELATREFDVSIVLTIAAKVLADREIIIGAAQSVMPAEMPAMTAKPMPKPTLKPKLPYKPKG